MSKSDAWRTGIVAAAIVALPLFLNAQSSQSGSSQSGTNQQQSGASGQSQQPPDQPQTTTGQGQGQGGFGQGQGQAANTRELALSHLTAARQALADLTRLPAVSHLQGDSRNQINSLISDFNALITSSGPEWRQAYDKVQGDLSSLVGPQPGTPGPNGQGNAAVGTSGSTSSLDPSVVAKLNDVRQQIDQFGEVVGVKPGQSAEQSGGAAATSGTVNEAALRNIDQIGVIVSRALSQPPSSGSNSDMVTVSRQDLQQIQQYLSQLRQSVGGQGPGR